MTTQSNPNATPSKHFYRDIIAELNSHDSEMARGALSLILGPVWTIVDHRIEPDRLVQLTYFHDEEEAKIIADRYRHERGCPAAAVEVVMLNRWQPNPA